MDIRKRFVWFPALLLCGGLISIGFLSGCGGGYDADAVREAAAEKKSDEAKEGEEDKSEVAGTEEEEVDTSNKIYPDSLIDKFEPPTFEELNAKVEWIDQPVLDSMELMKERQAKEPLLATVEEALSLKNNSAEENAKILSALGRGPEDDSQVDYNATINRHAGADVKSTNPLFLSSSIEFDVVGLTSFGFIGFDWNFTPYAASDTVVSWQSSKDGFYDKIVMRDDMTWSDGTPITAHDVVFSFKTIMDQRVPTPTQRSGTDKLKWVEAYDDHTLVFFHKDALATNVWNIGFSIIPKHIYEKHFEDDPTLQQHEYYQEYERNPVTGGAYQISSRVKDQEIVLERREDWYMHKGKQVRDKAHFKTIRFKVISETNTAFLALKKGDLDEMAIPAEYWLNQSKDDDFYNLTTKATGLEWTYFYFGWNSKTPFFEDKRVRHAMSFAYDHEEMLRVLLYDLYQPSTGIYHPDAWMARKGITPYKQNLDKAEELLAEAGWEDHDGDGILDKQIDGKKVDFKFSILVVNVQSRIDICTLLKESLEQIGIICNVKPIEFTSLMQKTRDHDFQAYFGGWGTGADPSTSDNIWTTNAIKNGRNYVSYSNPEVDELFKKAERELDREKRAEYYAQIHETLWEDQPYTWLYYRNAFFGFNKTLRGYVFSPRGPYNYGPGFSHIWKPADK